MKLIPYKREYSIIRDDEETVPHPAHEHLWAIPRWYVERLESHPQHQEVKRVRAQRALESANHCRN